MKYLRMTDFKGYLADANDEYLVRQIQQIQSEEMIINESRIKDLGTLTMLAFLKIDEFEVDEVTNAQRQLIKDTF